MHLHYGDLTDSTCLVKIISKVQPDEIYNLGAQSHVKVIRYLHHWSKIKVTITSTTTNITITITSNINISKESIPCSCWPTIYSLVNFLYTLLFFHFCTSLL